MYGGDAMRYYRLALLLLIVGGIGFSGATIQRISQLAPGTTVVVGPTTATVCGVLNVNTTSQATVSTVEEVLATYPLPANILNINGKGIRVTASFVGAATANAKVGKIRFGGLTGPVGATVSSSTSGAGFYTTALMFRTGASTQLIHGGAQGAATSSGGIPVAGTLTDTADINIVATGTTATAIGDLIFKSMLVECLN